MWFYILVFLSALFVDLIPFIGPPAWSVMVFFQMKFHLNIWIVLVAGVLGSTIGRYLLTLYVPWLTSKVINRKKDEDLQFLGKRLTGKKWEIRAFVFIYTLIPVPTTPLFTTIAVAKIKPMIVIPAFFMGKFISDMMMVYAGKYAAENAVDIAHGLLSWKTIAGASIGIILICDILFIDWSTLLMKKKLKLNFKIWK
jgi:hypothetical protein